MSTTLLWTVLLSQLAASTMAFSFAGSTIGWQQQQQQQQRSQLSTTTTTTSLQMARGKKGKLGSVFTDLASPPSTTKSRSSKKAPKKKNSEASISPALTQWAEIQATDKNSGTVNVSKQTKQTSLDSRDDAAVYSTFDDDNNDDNDSDDNNKPTKGRRSKKQKQASPKQAADQARTQESQLLVVRLETILKAPKPVMADILSVLGQWMQLPTGNLRLLTAATSTSNYRLAWVGSDDAVTHIGTGLHKVPLARLQEVFLTLKGKARIQMQEVIRILGPFPNVLNTLQGSSQIVKTTDNNDNTDNTNDNNVVGWSITWDSMVDGTGKELLAGTQENKKTVNLQVYYCDPSVLVAVVPPASGTVRADPLEADGAHVLVFVRDETMDETLEALRVA
jgi:hypothetical protein